MAMDWDPSGPIGSIGRLFHDVPPAFDGVSFDTFKIAANAVHVADLVLDLSSPLAKQAIGFVIDDSHQPHADAFTAAALAARIGMHVDARDRPNPGALGEDIAADVYKRCKAFLGAKTEKLPS